jgi:hypothetical protein
LAIAITRTIVRPLERFVLALEAAAKIPDLGKIISEQNSIKFIHSGDMLDGFPSVLEQFMGFLQMLCLSFAVAIVAQAQEPPRLQLGAFGTLGVAASSTHQVEYPREVFQPNGTIDQLNGRMDSRLGAQADVAFSDTVFATLQLVSKYRYNGTYMPGITWADVAWNPVSDLQLRAGRMSFELFENGMARDVGYSYLWVRPPTEVFAQIPVASLDGVDASQRIQLGAKANLTLRVYGGVGYGMVPLWAQNAYQNVSGGRCLGLNANLQTGPWKVRAAVLQAVIPNEFPGYTTQTVPAFQTFSTLLQDPQLMSTANEFSIKGAHSRGYGLGVLYHEDPFQLEGYVNRLDYYRFLAPATTSGYLSMGYRLGAVVPYGMYARAVSKQIQTPYLGAIPQLPYPAAQAFASGIATFVQSRNMDQYTWSTGLRWDFADHADLKLQVDRVHARRSPILYDVEPGYQGQFYVMSAVVDFVFGGGQK